MENLVRIRAQAALCREFAVGDPGNKAHWLAEAERWSRLAQDEITAHYAECNVIQPSEAEATAA